MGVLADWQIEQCKPLSPMEPGIKRDGKISYGLSSYGYDIRLGYKFKIFTNVWGSVVDPKNFDPDAFVEIDLTQHDYNRDRQCDRCAIYQIDAKNLPSVYGSCKNPVDYILIPPNSFALGESLEEFNIPRDVLGICMGKSTYARCGIIVNVTPLEPEWEGKLTIEISNTTPLPAKIYAGEGIAQVYFLRSDGTTRAILDSLISYFEAPTDIDEPKTTLKRLIRLTCPDNKNGTCLVSYKDKQGKYQAQEGLTLPKVD